MGKKMAAQSGAAIRLGRTLNSQAYPIRRAAKVIM